MTSVLTEIIDILVSGFTGFASGIGTGLNELVRGIFLDGTGETTKLSVFGGVIIIFAGISLVIGLSRFVVNWLTSLGN